MNPTDWHAFAQLYPALGEAVSAPEALAVMDVPAGTGPGRRAGQGARKLGFNTCAMKQ